MTAEPRNTSQSPVLVVAGWHERISLSGLGLERVYAKLDTGADRSTVHATQVVLSHDESHVEFSGPLLRVQRDCAEFPSGGIRRLKADVVDVRVVRSSSGEEQRRPVIATQVVIGEREFLAHFSLTDRGGLRFCVLLGRDVLASRFLVDSSSAHLLEPDGSRICLPLDLGT